MISTPIVPLVRYKDMEAADAEGDCGLALLVWFGCSRKLRCDLFQTPAGPQCSSCPVVRPPNSGGISRSVRGFRPPL